MSFLGFGGKGHKEKVTELQAITGCSEKQAQDLLKELGWQVDRAADAFFERGLVAPKTRGGVAAGAGTSKLESDFQTFEDPADKGHMNIEQIEAFGAAIGIDPFSDVLMLYLCYNMGCAQQGVITKEEYIKGMSKLGVDTAAALRAKIDDVRRQMTTPANFSGFYKWCYKFSCEPGQKTITLDTAVALTPMLLSPAKYPLVEKWVDFLRTTGRTVSRDTWDQALTFFQTVDADLSNFVETSYIPVQLEEFVEHIRKSGKKK